MQNNFNCVVNPRERLMVRSEVFRKEEGRREDRREEKKEDRREGRRGGDCRHVHNL